VDARSDVYSTGCLLYELVTGAPPFSGDTPVAVAYQHVREDPVPPSQVEPDVSPAVDAIVLKAMAKNPAHRYQSAALMRIDLERALAGQPVEAAPVLTEDHATVLPAPATTVLVRQPQRRRGRGLAYGLLAAAVLVVFVLALLVAGRLLKTSGGDVNTPNLIGLSLSDAQSLLASKGLHAGKVAYQYDDTGKYANGEVMGQDPAADILLSKGQSVQLTVSRGVEQVVVPNGLVGLTQDEAKRAITAARLKVGQVVPRNSDQPAGQVLQVDPASGSTVPINTSVQLVVSNGKVQVPKVVGMTVADATQALQQAGFQVQLNPDSSPPGAHVVSQDPAPGSYAAYGSVVSLQTDAPPPSPTASPTPSATPTQSPSPSPTESPTPSPTVT
jgi:serine/threonine-protein kinase